ncbi:MAG: glucosaminidase domain-containing protein [Rhodospirillales bacterium]|nr:glucosaminidase domain-containing protein [Rhodospirillales bacterium]MDH3965438.1 glucosaminidase domain-containing protein [Rhodospirillales bacterium]
MGRDIEYSLLPPAGRVLYTTIGGVCVLAALVAAGVAATIPSEADLASIGSHAGIPSLVGSERLPVQSLVRPADSGHLQSVFETLDYDLKAVRSGGATVPRVYVTALPEDLSQVAPTEKRKALFLSSVLPLVLMANEELYELRARIRALRERMREPGGPSEDDEAWLRRVSARYSVSADQGIDELLRRVDAVPVSLALAQSIEESGWGTSRFARVGNALFGQRTWANRVAGVVPAGRDRDQTFRVRSYMNLMGAVRSYMHNLNTHPAYASLRAARARQRAAGQPADGYALAETLLGYSERGEAYVAQLRGLMRVNGLAALERARLSATAKARRVAG